MKTLNPVLRSLPVQSLFVALILGVLNNWTYQFALGYSAGLNDHSVLSLVGIQWSDPSKFVNDWFIESAPQPHWLFDVVTYIGATTGTISWLYFLYWCFGLVAFGFATLLLARQWVPTYSFVAALSVTLIISQTPWNVVGSGSIMIAQALPTVLAGQIMYLTLALLLTGRRKLVPWFAALIGVVHVQQGAVIGIILLVSLSVEWFATKKLDWKLVFGSVAAFLATGFGLWLRPVAANLNDFVEVCETIIPYHCAAHTWGFQGIVAFTGLIGLALVTWFYMSRGNRRIWVTSVGLAAGGLLLGMYLDAHQVIKLGELAQSVNVYRLGVLVIPFTAWGVLVPILRAEWSKKFLLLFSLWVISLSSYFLLGGWSFGSRKVGALIAVLIAVLAIISAIVSKNSPANNSRRDTSLLVGTIITGLSFIVAAAIAGSIIIRPLTIEFMPDRSFAQWGQQVEHIVPSGDIILAPPLSHTIRLATGRGVIADCKTVPYGGNAWAEWKERIHDLGGIKQCTQPTLANFSTFSAEKLNTLAEKYGADFMVLDPEHFESQRTALRQLGWVLKLDSMPGVSAVLIGRS